MGTGRLNIIALLDDVLITLGRARTSIASHEHPRGDHRA
jgi:hypothetical protein